MRWTEMNEVVDYTPSNFCAFRDEFYCLSIWIAKLWLKKPKFAIGSRCFPSIFLDVPVGTVCLIRFKVLTIWVAFSPRVSFFHYLCPRSQAIFTRMFMKTAFSIVLGKSSQFYMRQSSVAYVEGLGLYANLFVFFRNITRLAKI